MLGLILSIIIIGLIAGALARLLVPGRQHMSIPMTVLLGVVGSFVGGFLGYCSSTRTLRTASSSPRASLAPSSERSSFCSYGLISARAARYDISGVPCQRRATVRCRSPQLRARSGRVPRPSYTRSHPAVIPRYTLSRRPRGRRRLDPAIAGFEVVVPACGHGQLGGEAGGRGTGR